jgi:hypothetical protein
MNVFSLNNLEVESFIILILTINKYSSFIFFHNSLYIDMEQRFHTCLKTFPKNKTDFYNLIVTQLMLNIELFSLSKF